MTDKEKLIARLNASFEMQYSKRCLITAQHTADDLISYGVTLAKDTNVPSWIPVTDRLPESGKWVLCACRANIVEVLKYDSTMDDWDSTMPERCYMKGFVTHWMPLPEAPKGG